MDAVTLWVRIDGEWRHGTTSEDVMAVELVGVAVCALGVPALIAEVDEDPNTVDTVVVEYGGVSS